MQKNYEKEKQLSICYHNSMLIAKENDLKTIAFPNISTGIYRFPKQLAAEIAIRTVTENPILEKVIFVCFDDENYEIYQEILK